MKLVEIVYLSCADYIDIFAVNKKLVQYALPVEKIEKIPILGLIGKCSPQIVIIEMRTI